jgi:hypothetical protein
MFIMAMVRQIAKADHDGLNEKGDEDGVVVGADVQREKQREQREEIVKGAWS